MVHVDQGEAALQNLSSGRVLNCEVKSMDKRKCHYINYAKSLQSEVFFQKEIKEGATCVQDCIHYKI